MLDLADGTETLLRNRHITKRSFYSGRWHVSLYDPLSGKTDTIPQAQYNWLLANPSFEKIPKGYVIHHLDLNGINDDPSNLALMQKHLHVAYHLKFKKIDALVYFPRKNGKECPDFLKAKTFKVYHRKNVKKGGWYIQWFEDGKQFRISEYEDKRFKTKEDAEKVKTLFESQLAAII